jgi:osmoprotectant transport system permease protein
VKRCALALLWLPLACLAEPVVNVGSKRFTESYIVAEIVAQTVHGAGEARAVHQQGLGNTGIVFSALKSGAIDVYPEYTGTVAFELLGRKSPASLEDIARELAPLGLGIGVPLGFGNSYALAMPAARAAALEILNISDLRRHPNLRPGISQEFLNRRDGWPALRAAYGLPFAAPRGLDHGLAYEALASGQVDLIDIYTTDAKIGRYALHILADDRAFFPAYDAVLLYRLDLPRRLPKSWAALQALQGRIPAQRMIAMNAEVELMGATFAEVAKRFLITPGAPTADSAREERASFAAVLLADDLARLTVEHLLLVFASLALSVAAGVPLGILAARSARAAAWILSAVGLLQTVPSLALLAFLITALGTIGTAPAVVALFLYALLPIVRNTASGLADIASPLKESALALGLSGAARLRLIELPLAARSILAGVKTSAVINVGTATIAAFVGAGGYGERIVAGLAVNDNAMLLAGAIPAAALALAIQWMFDVLERRMIPEGLRDERASPTY